MAHHLSDLRGLPRWHPDPLVRETLDRIRRCGWAVTAVSDECTFHSHECETPDCSFAYTTGLRLHDLPELAVYGLGARASALVLNELGSVFHTYDWHSIVSNSVPVQLESLDVPVTVIELMDKSDLTVTNVLYPDAPVLQAVWPDDLGSYPWDEGYTLAVAVIVGGVGTIGFGVALIVHNWWAANVATIVTGVAVSSFGVALIVDNRWAAGVAMSASGSRR